MWLGGCLLLLFICCAVCFFPCPCLRCSLSFSPFMVGSLFLAFGPFTLSSPVKVSSNIRVCYTVNRFRPAFLCSLPLARSSISAPLQYLGWRIPSKSRPAKSNRNRHGHMLLMHCLQHDGEDWVELWLVMECIPPSNYVQSTVSCTCFAIEYIICHHYLQCM